MQVTRIIKGKCGTCHIYGGAVVEVNGAFFATKQNVSAIDQAVASCAKNVYSKYGIKRFSTFSAAKKFAQ